MISNPLGGPLLHLDTTTSTNDRARELALAGAPTGTVVVAEQQTAGRGRQGRSWVAPRGSALTASIVLRPDEQLLRALPLLAPLAVCEACESVADVQTAIKWPNDVWIDGMKVAGILIESRPQERWATLGVGINVGTEVHDFPPELRDVATSLKIAAAADVSRELMLEALLARLDVRLRSDSESVLDDYRQRDALHGHAVRWAGGNGTAQGVDERGNLIVFTDAGERLELDAGEVHLLR